MKKITAIALTLSLTLSALLTGCGSTSDSSDQASFPDRQVEIVVGYSAGSSPDLLARALADRLSEKWGVPVMVTNKTDGSSATAIKEFLSTAEPDGYTITIGTIADLCLHMAVNKQPLYDASDFTYVCQTSQYPMSVTVKADAPWNTFGELSDWVVKNPGELLYCSSSMTGASAFATAEWVNTIGGDFNAARLVPITGSSDAAVKVAGGNATVIIGSITGVLPMVEAGELKILAMTPYADPNYPDIPSAEESGVSGLTFGNWNGIVMPSGVSEDILNTWREALGEICSDEAFIDQMQKVGVPVVYADGADWEQQVLNSIEDYKQLAEELGLRK